MMYERIYFQHFVCEEHVKSHKDRDIAIHNSKMSCVLGNDNKGEQHQGCHRDKEELIQIYGGKLLGMFEEF